MTDPTLVPAAAPGPLRPGYTVEPGEPGEPDAPAAGAASTARKPSDQRSLIIPVLLAALGLAAALIAWRASTAASAADDATGAGLAAARQQATSAIVAEGLTARTTEAFLDYERARRRADALAAAGQADEALLARMEATSHWFLVRPDYIDRAGAFQPDQMRAALLAADAQQRDLAAEPHFAAADAEYDRIRGLIVAGIVVVLALPFLTLAEIARGRLRRSSGVVGGAFFAVGLLLAALAWW